MHGQLQVAWRRGWRALIALINLMEGRNAGREHRFCYLRAVAVPVIDDIERVKLRRKRGAG